MDKMLYTDVMTQLAEHGLMIVDRTSMAFSLESRPPFLDRRMAEFCATLPSELKIRQHRIRYLERLLARKYLPPEVARRRKQGFGLPLGYWFQGTLGELTADLFHDSSLAQDGYLSRDGLLSVLEEYRRQGVDHSHRLWMLLNLDDVVSDFCEERRASKPSWNVYGNRYTHKHEGILGKRWLRRNSIAPVFRLLEKVRALAGDRSCRENRTSSLRAIPKTCVLLAQTVK